MYLARSTGLVLLVRSAVLLTSMAAASEVGPLTGPEKSFLASTQASMRTMMAGMEIIVEQQAEIAVMQREQTLPRVNAARTGVN